MLSIEYQDIVRFMSSIFSLGIRAFPVSHMLPFLSCHKYPWDSLLDGTKI